MTPSPVLQRTRPPNSATFAKTPNLQQRQHPQHPQHLHQSHQYQMRDFPHAGPPQEQQPQQRHQQQQQAMHEHRLQQPHLQQPQHYPKKPVLQGPDYDGATKWFDDPAHFQQMLDEVAAISLEKTFKEELNAVEHWFKVLSEPEKTSALYSLFRLTTHMQLRFFCTVLLQRARSDPVLAAEMAEKEQQRFQQSQAHRLLSSLTPGGRNDDFLRTPVYPSGRGTVSAATLGPDGEMASIYGSNWNYPASPRMSEGTPMLSMPSVPLTASPLRPSGRPSSTLEPDRLAAGASPALGNQRPRSAMGLRLSSGVSPAWNGTPLSAAALSFQESVGSSIERPKSAGPTPNASMFKGNAQVAAAGAASPPPLSSSAAADSARLSNPPATATGLRPPPLTLAANAYRDSFYHPSGSKSAVATTFMRSMFELGSPTANTKSDAPAQSNVAGGYLGVNAGLTARGGSRGASPAAPPGRLPMSAPGPNSAWRSTTATANAALSPSVSSPSRLAYTSPRPVLNKAKLGHEVPDAPTSASKVGRTPTGPKRGTGQDPADVHLLKTDIPGWLRSLRLHKYTTNFAGKTWQEVIKLTDDDLQKMGVAAMGARNKMLRVFESTRATLAIAEL